MEYRVRFRDVPWGIALFVLPGKIIGTFIIKPILWFKEDPLHAALRTCLGAAVGLLIFVSLSALDGMVFEEKLGVVKAIRYVLGDWEEHEEAKRQAHKENALKAIAEAKRLKEDADRNARAAQTCYKDAYGRCR